MAVQEIIAAPSRSGLAPYPAARHDSVSVTAFPAFPRFR
jgi:hypothetical protein